MASTPASARPIPASVVPELNSGLPAPAELPAVVDSARNAIASLAAAALRQPLTLPQFDGRAAATLASILHSAPLAPPASAVHVAPRKTVGERAAEAAKSKIGAAYEYGSAGPNAFDCSGLVQWSYKQADVDLPRTSYAQLRSGTPVSMNDLQEGDMVSFYGGEHSAIYIGDGKVVHASTYGRGVEVSPLSEMPVCGARRF
ncbi:C40 family peptidase [Nocardia sp. NEAU-G5]|uniref:C40 family peptidase n=1 Tax=Nocardia albiluteola TaxID=2842303 RepID=A0ABS6ATK7_9NOCA|nr:C40 family peptidase [Nocardia albiluteola]